MATEDRGLFRQKSLEKLSSPERLDQLLQLVDARTWLPLGALAGLVFLIALWSVFGSIPVYVEGRGILKRPSQIVEIEASASGQILAIKVEEGGQVSAGDVIAVMSRPEIETRLQLQRRKLVELQELSLEAERLRGERTRAATTSSRGYSESLRAHIASYRSLSDRLRDQALQALAEERAREAEQLRLANSVAASARKRLDGQRDLARQGLISDEAKDAAELAHLDALARVTALEGRLQELGNRELEVEEAHLERMRRTEALRFELEGLEVKDRELAQENQASEGVDEQRIADARREVSRLEAMLDEQARIVANQDGRILELSAVPGEVLEVGDRLGSLEVVEDDAATISVSYFRVGDGKRLERGSPIRITPDSVKRSRYGSMTGTIERISDLPVTPAEVRNEVGNPVVAESLIAGGYLIQVVARLDRDPDAPSGFAWTSSKGPPAVVSAGTTAHARAAIERRRPITFVLPIFKETVGLD